MKFLKVFLLSIITITILTGCGNKKYVGYWCNYDETGTIIITMEEKNTKNQRTKIETIINNFSGLSSFDFVPKESFTAESETDAEAYDTYLIYFMDTTKIDEHVMALEKLAGVQKVEKNYVKSNVLLYEFVDSKKYKFQDGIDIEDNLKVTGKYEIKDNTITLSSPTKQTTLYIKNNYLCGDTECNTIYSKTDSKCEKIVTE